MMLFKTNWGNINLLVRDLAAFLNSQETFTKMHSHVKQFTCNLKTKIVRWVAQLSKKD